MIKKTKAVRGSKARSDKVKNPVAKHAGTFNKAQVHKDRKKDSKRGYSRHKPDLKDGESED